MTGTRDSLSAMIGDLTGTDVICRRILQTMFPLLLMLPRRINFKQMALWGERNEGAFHSWYKKGLCLDEFNRPLIDRHGPGDCFVISGPSFLPKSGKQHQAWVTTGRGRQAPSSEGWR